MIKKLWKMHIDYADWIEEYDELPIHNTEDLKNIIFSDHDVMDRLTSLWYEHGWDAQEKCEHLLDTMYYATYECIEQVVVDIFVDFES